MRCSYQPAPVSAVSHLHTLLASLKHVRLPAKVETAQTSHWDELPNIQEKFIKKKKKKAIVDWDRLHVKHPAGWCFTYFMSLNAPNSPKRLILIFSLKKGGNRGL